jgi:hypothetical protein
MNGPGLHCVPRKPGRWPLKEALSWRSGISRIAWNDSRPQVAEHDRTEPDGRPRPPY